MMVGEKQKSNPLYVVCFKNKHFGIENHHLSFTTASYR